MTCADQTVVGSVPGRQGFWLSDGGFFQASLGLAPPVGAVVACGDSVFAGGDAGLWRLEMGMLQPRTLDAVVVAAARGGSLAWVTSATPTSLQTSIPGVTRVQPVGCPISAVTWVDSARAVVGCSSSGRVFFVNATDGGTRLILDGGVPLAGRALASGDVWWNAGDEVLVGAAQKVLVFDADGRFITALHHADPSFGTALAVTAGPYDVDTLWVGVPDAGVVWSFIGDSGVASDPFPQGFGASIAASGRRILVGAPAHFAGAGAVYASGPTGMPTLNSTAMECPPGLCVVNCMPGTCVGGVLCIHATTGLCADAGEGVDAGELDAGPSNDAGSNDAGSNDAGSDDAGSSDAGSRDAGSSDAGSSDAGSSDAGSSDADSGDAGSGDAGSGDAGSGDAGFGEVRFATAGCSVGPTGSFALALLVLTARRRR